jgi:diphthine synthase
MLYVIGIGLHDARDISVKGLDIVRKCQHIYFEHYTSLLHTSFEELERFYGKPVMAVGREMVESGTEILDRAKESDVAFLVVGDAFGATTHTDLYLRAKSEGIPVEVVHNASVLTAVGVTGLELYKFGRTTSLPFWTDNFKPESAYDAILENWQRGLHTLVLLDIKVEEGKFMTVCNALDILERIEAERKQGLVTKDTKFVGCARLGGDSVIKYGTLEQLRNVNWGKPLHCLIIPGQLHFVEEEALAALECE